MPLDTRQIQPFGPQPTLLDRIHADTVKRAQISQTTRAEDAAQRTQRAYQMLEGIEEQPSTGYGSLFGQRTSPQNEFRTVDDAAAFLRATDPEGMKTRQDQLGDFMANQALPRLTSVQDPAQRVAVLKQMAASGPPMLNRLVREIAADGVITDEELAQAEGMYGSYRKAAESPWKPLGGDTGTLYSTDPITGQPRFATAPGGGGRDPFKGVTGEAGGIARLHAMIADETLPEATRAAARTALEAIERGNQRGDGRATEWETKLAILRNPSAYSEAERQWANGGGGQGMTVTTPDGTTVQLGGPANAPVQNQQAGIALAIDAVRPQWIGYGKLLNDPRLSPSTAGMTGAVLSAVRGVSNQIPLTRQAVAWADKHSPVRLLPEQARQARYVASMMAIQLAPVFAAVSKGNPSNKDILRVQEAIGLLGATDDLNTARFAYAYLTDYMNRLYSQARTVTDTERLPARGDGRPQATPVIPPPPASPSTNRARDLLNRMRPGG